MKDHSKLETTLLNQAESPISHKPTISIEHQTSKEMCAVDGLIARLLSTIDVGSPVREETRFRYNRMRAHLHRKKELDRVAKLV